MVTRLLAVVLGLLGGALVGMAATTPAPAARAQIPAAGWISLLPDLPQPALATLAPPPAPEPAPAPAPPPGRRVVRPGKAGSP